MIASLNSRLESACVAWMASRDVDARPCAIDLSSSFAGEERTELISTVRKELERGASPNDLGLCFVVAMAELAYDVDWTDSFRFWPLLQVQLGVSRFDLARQAEQRACTAAVQRAISEHRLIIPDGRFAKRCPHMSLLLFNAAIPRCCHRRMARLLRESVEAGVSLTHRASTERLPMYLRGLLEHPALAARVEGELTATAQPSATMVRVLGDIERAKDEEARRDLEAARQGAQARRRLSGRPLLACRRVLVTAPKLVLVLEVPPLEELSGGFTAILERAAGAYATIGGRICSKSTATVGEEISGGYLVNARTQGCQIALPFCSSIDAELQVELVVRDQAGAVDIEASAALGGLCPIKSPCVFAAREGSRYDEVAALSPGDEIVVLCHRDSLIAAASVELIAPSVSLGNWALLAGEATAEVAEALDIPWDASNATRLLPVLVPPILRRSAEVVYQEGDDAWILLYCAEPLGLASIDHEDCGTVSVRQELSSREILFRIVATAGPATARSSITAVTAEGTIVAKLSIRWTKRPFARPVAWLAKVTPADATATQLSGGHCSLWVWDPLGRDIETELLLTSGYSARATYSVTSQGILSHRLPSLAGNFRGAAQGDVASGGVEAVRLRVWPHGAEADATEFVFAADIPVARFDVRDLDALILTSDPGEGSNHLTYVHPDGSCQTSVLTWCDVIDGMAAEGLYLVTRAGRTSSLIWAGEGAAQVVLPPPISCERSLAIALAVTSWLRALDVGTTGPRARSARAHSLQAAWVQHLEYALVRVLCGERWLAEEVATEGLDTRASIERLASLAPVSCLDIADLWLGTPAEIEPRLMETLEGLEKGENERIQSAAKHLLQLFMNRCAAPATVDAAALSWALADQALARLVRLISVFAHRRFSGRWSS